MFVRIVRIESEQNDEPHPHDSVKEDKGRQQRERARNWTEQISFAFISEPKHEETDWTRLK